MNAKTLKGNSAEELEKRLEEHISDGFKPTLAIVFISIKQDADAVCEILNKKGIQIFGSTSSGEFTDEEIGEGSMAVMLLDLNPAWFRIVFLETGDDSVPDISRQLGAEAKKIFSNPAFIIASGWSNEMDGEEIINGIEEGFKGGATIFGGMAGDECNPAFFGR